MIDLELKGGYGEHGRSCFLLKQDNGHSMMFDCGILDTAPVPHPDISQYEAAHIDYLFLSHAHKDHTGAVSYLIRKGFQGTILASQETLHQTDLPYNKVQELKNGQTRSMNFPGFQVTVGRSGHCPGSLWFHVCFDEGYKFFYSGDFQPNPLVYQVDVPKNLEADIAIVDMAYDTLLDGAAILRDNLLAKARESLNSGKRIILPLQAFGRGVEILYLFGKTLPDCKIWLDPPMKAITERILAGPSIWEERRQELAELYRDVKRNTVDEADIVIIGDTHLELPENQEMVRGLLSEGAVIIGTGRRKDGSFMAQMYDENKAVRLPFPHHSSRKDALWLSERNHFMTVLPFHSGVKEVWKPQYARR